MKREEIISTALLCKGTKFRVHGRVPGVSLDCVGLLQFVGTRFAIPFSDVPAYSLAPSPVLQEHMNRYMQRGSEIKPGSALLMQIDGQKYPWHAAIVTSPTTIIHGFIQTRKVVVHTLTNRWLDAIIAVYEFPGVED